MKKLGWTRYKSHSPTQPAFNALSSNPQGLVLHSLAEFPEQTIQHDHDRAVGSLPGTLPPAAHGPFKANKSLGPFIRCWESFRAWRQEFHRVQEQPSVTSVWEVWGGEQAHPCVCSSGWNEGLWALGLGRAGMCSYLGERSTLDCSTGSYLCREKGQC